MTEPDGVYPAAISFRRGVVQLSNGEEPPIVRWFDDQGEDCPCRCSEHTALIVAGPDRAGRWWWLAADGHEPPTRH